jgi:hypothetical protein
VDDARAGLVALGAFLLLALLHANPVLLLAAAGVAGWILFGGRR